LIIDPERRRSNVAQIAEETGDRDRRLDSLACAESPVGQASPVAAPSRNTNRFRRSVVAFTIAAGFVGATAYASADTGEVVLKHLVILDNGDARGTFAPVVTRCYYRKRIRVLDDGTTQEYYVQICHKHTRGAGNSSAPVSSKRRDTNGWMAHWRTRTPAAPPAPCHER
jgi:hypothetical protein